MRGSSPLTRGALGDGADSGPGVGIIPAHAGCTPTPARSTAPTPGSSPLTRGAQRPRARHEPWPGIIPAHAGCTPRVPGPGSRAADHPRSRGVHLTLGIFASLAEGSSPLTRGARALWGTNQLPGRIIPAHAGCTLRKPNSPNDDTRCRPPVFFSATLAHARCSTGIGGGVQRSTNHQP